MGRSFSGRVASLINLTKVNSSTGMFIPSYVGCNNEQSSESVKVSSKFEILLNHFCLLLTIISRDLV